MSDEYKRVLVGAMAIEQLLEINEAVQQLEAAGLVVRRYSWDEDKFDSLIGMTDHEEKYTTLKDVMSLRYFDNHWHVAKHAYTPGPGPEDFEFACDTLEQAITVVLNCYFGEPTIVDKWILPLHQHPEWDGQRVDDVVMTAKQVKLEEWNSIKSDYTRRYLETRRLWNLPFEEMFTFLFNTIPHSENPDLTLHLRRDLGAAFIVQQPETE